MEFLRSHPYAPLKKSLSSVGLVYPHIFDLQPAFEPTQRLIVRVTRIAASDRNVQQREKCLVRHLAPLLTRSHTRTRNLEECLTIQIPRQLLPEERTRDAIHLERPGMVVAAGEIDLAAQALVLPGGVLVVKRALIGRRAVDQFEDIPLAAFRPTDGGDVFTERPEGRPHALLLRCRMAADPDLGLENHLVPGVAGEAVLAFETRRGPVARGALFGDDIELAVAGEVRICGGGCVFLDLVVGVGAGLRGPIVAVHGGTGGAVEVVGPDEGITGHVWGRHDELRPRLKGYICVKRSG